MNTKLNQEEVVSIAVHAIKGASLDHGVTIESIHDRERSHLNWHARKARACAMRDMKCKGVKTADIATAFSVDASTVLNYIRDLNASEQ